MPKINQEEYGVLKELDEKWIARDHEGKLWAYRRKPTKENKFWCEGILIGLNNGSLQFIQWEDEEPHNIAELIEEYEYHNEPVKLAGGLSITQAKYDKYLEEHIKELENESEGTEVKNFEWVKEEVDRAYRKGFKEGERQTAEYFERITEEPTQEQVWKYLSEHGIEVVDKEPETVADVIADFFKSLERLKEVMNMEVEEMEE